ncbi:unnamed protein product [Durusdinium trenchii]|uniref:Uncharacterized protein n=1 Tax=Durusdinium trenchii TaxID=1381693 RepID=A0ABP0RB43_9DINO
MVGVRHGSFIEGADQFDASFFGLSPAETQAQDPQQRLVLSTSYKALAAAGHDQGTLQGAPMSIFVALSNQDWYHWSLNATPTAYTGTGVSAALAANRISFALGLRGTSATIDTACSSSLTSIQAAAESLQRPSRRAGPACRRRLRESVAAGCELLLGPNSVLLRSSASMLSPTGRCQTFNATADGYVRGEGSGAILLTLGEDPSWAGSQVMLCASTTNQDGRSTSLTAPNGQAQQEVLLDALWMAAVPAAAVSFVECHGTGTALGDPIEVGALRRVLGAHKEEKLWLAAGKSNMGHLEAAAGLAGLAKAMCCLLHRAVPPNLHFASLNPHIELDKSCLAVPCGVSQLSQSGQMIAGLSSFGFGGTNAHALLRVASQARPEPVACMKVAMLFTGHNRFRPGQFQELYTANTAFRVAMDRCAKLCSSYLEHSLLDVLFSAEDPMGRLSSSALYSFTATFCLQYAMVDMWQARGVRPVAVLGHSLGEFAAAVSAGVFSLEDGLRLVAARGRLLDEKCSKDEGRMAAIFAPANEVQAIVDEYQDLSVSGINSPCQTVVSGRKDQVEAICKRFPEKSKILGSHYAMHSDLVSDVRAGVKEEIKACTFAPPTSGISFVSSMTGSVEKEEVTKEGYWLSHDSAKPVNFWAAAKHLEKIGCNAFIEIGSRPVLTRLAQTFCQVPGAMWLTTLEPEREETESLLSTCRALQGVQSKGCELQPQRFPWVKPLLHPLLGSLQQTGQVCSIQSKTLLRDADAAPPAVRLFRQHRVDGEAVLPAASHLLLMAAGHLKVDHETNGSKLSLGASYFVELEDITFEQLFALPGPSEEAVQAEVRIEPEGGEGLQLRSRTPSIPSEYKIHARSRRARVVGGPGARGAILQQSLTEWKSKCKLRGPDAYRTLELRKLQYGPSFATIVSWSSFEGHAMAHLSLSSAEAWEYSIGLLHPGILDGAFQLLVLTHSTLHQEVPETDTLLPFSVANCVLGSPAELTGDCWATVHVQRHAQDFVTGIVEVSKDGLLIARLTGATMRCRKTRVPVAKQEANPIDVTFELSWDPWTPQSSDQGLLRPKALLCCSEENAGWLRRSLLWDSECCHQVADLSTIGERLRAEEFDKLAFLAEDDPMESLVKALTFLQVVHQGLQEGATRVERLTVLLVTQCTQPPQLDLKTYDPRHAGLWGLARSARLECDFRVVLLDLTCEYQSDDAQLSSKVFNEEEEACMREKVQYVSRLRRSELQPTWPIQMSLPSRGSLSALTAEPQARNYRSPSHPAPAPLLRVAAVGLNFRDVLNVMGLYPGDPGDPGLDCSGIVAQSDDRLPFDLGESVFGISFGCLRSYADIKEPKLLAKRPLKWSFTDAAALPTVFATVDEAFRDADLKAGQRVLVHAGAGGVGLTAVQYALQLGALVYATAGRQEKKQHLLQMGVKFVANSRDGKMFEEELCSELANGEKMDVVLNSLSHDNFIGRSLAFLREGGTFVEIGKRGIWTQEQMQQQRPDIVYKVLAMDTICEQEPDRFNSLMVRLVKRMETDWTALHCQVFEGLSQCSEALQVLRKAEKIGKLVISVPPLVHDGTYVLSGGTGALGLFVGRALVEEGAQDLVLISRSGGKELELQRSAAKVQIWQCDLASNEAVDVLKAQLERAHSTQAINGVFHLAGLLQDGMLGRLGRADLEAVFGPKVYGLKVLKHVFGEKLDFLLSFSSTASIFGAAGQGNYAAANACMDAWMYKWRLEGLNATSLQWGAWMDIGMAAQHGSFKHLSQQGISRDLGMAMIVSVLRTGCSFSSLSCAKVDWNAFLKPVGFWPPKCFSYMHVEKDNGQRSLEQTMDGQFKAVQTLEWVVSVAFDVIGELEADDPLMSAGMDSLSAVEFRRRLSSERDINLPSTLAFDYPTARAIAGFVDLQSKPIQGTQSAFEPSTVQSIYFTGTACRFPGSTASSPQQAWEHVFKMQLDAVAEIPLQRFDVNEFFDSTGSGVGFVTYARHASFIDGVDLFDNRFFGISSNEAAAIDPQQRHSLEVAYAACHAAGRSRKQLMKTSTGVFVGQCANDWGKTSKERKAGTFMGPGTHASISANRISFCLGLEGVSATVDTACSSTLVALDLSLQRLDHLDAVICSGGQINLIAEPFVAFSNGRLLSASGRCRTFDASADGFTRGEGFGAFFLTKDGPSVVAPAGSMANQDGRSSSLTAPNGPAQQRAITGALKLAGAAGTDIAAVECHGTGTALGDPIEVGALRGTLRENRRDELALMAGKTNVGHLEGAAGALGLVKCIKTLEHVEVPPNVHLEKLNPHIDLKDFLATVPCSSKPLTAASAPKVGLSSFGFGGTNAHAILGVQESSERTNRAEELPELNFRSVSFPCLATVPRLLCLCRSGQEKTFEVQLDLDLAKFSRTVHDKILVSSSLFLALAIEGCQRIKQQAAQLKGVRITAPLILPPEYDGHIWLRLSISEQQFEVCSRHRYSQKAWLVHCVGRFSVQAATRPPAGTLNSLSILGSSGLRQRPAPQRGSESFEALCRSAEPVDDSFEELKRKATEQGLQLCDDSVALLSDVHVGKGEICARVKVPADVAAFTAHPALLDVLQTAVLAFAVFGESKQLAQDLTSVASFSVPSQEIPKGTEYLILHARERRYGISPDSLSASCTVSVDRGPVLLDVQELQLRPVNWRQVSQSLTPVAESELAVPSLYELQWSPASSSGRTFIEEGGKWLLFCPGDQELAEGLQQAIEKEKAQKTDEGRAPEDKEEDDSDSDKGSAGSEEDVEARLSASSCASSARRSPVSKSPTTICTDTLPEELESFDKIFLFASGPPNSDRALEVLAAALLVMKTLWQLVNRSKPAEIWFVVEGTQAAQLEDLAKASIPFHGGLWGLARCARREQRSDFVGCIDAGCSSGVTGSALGLWRRLRRACANQEDGREQELLVRRSALGGEEDSEDSEDGDVERHITRLEQTRVKAHGVWPPPAFPSHSWFLISGGCGGLGIATAGWLVTQGVTHLALSSRTGKCQQDGPESADLQRLCSETGVQVLLHACDITSQAQVDSTLQTMRAFQDVPVKGVVHAAGLLEDHVIAHMERSHLQPVLSPKMDGAVNLHAALSGTSLDQFLMFSSVAALLGSPGQGNYAAANSFLDCFAQYRQAKGLPALSLQWGPWAEVGMAARGGVGGPGFWAPKIAAADALKALGSVLTAPKSGPSAIGITRVNWSILLKRLSSVPPAWANFKSHWEPPVEPKEAKVGLDKEQEERKGIGMNPGEPRAPRLRAMEGGPCVERQDQLAVHLPEVWEAWEA